MNKYSVTYGLVPPQSDDTPESHILPVTKFLKPRDDGRTFLTCGRDGTVIKHSEKAKFEGQRMQVNSDWVTDMIQVGNNRYVVVSQDLSVTLLTLHDNDGTPSWDTKIIGYHRDYVKCAGLLELSSDGFAKFATCGLDMKINVWSLDASGEAAKIQVFDNRGPNETGSLYAMATIIDSKFDFDIIGGDNNGNLIFIASATGAKIAEVKRAHDSNIKLVKLFDSETKVLTTSSDGIVKLWDLNSQRGPATHIYTWKWPTSVWCIEGHSSRDFFLGDSRGNITNLKFQSDKWDQPSLTTVYHSEDNSYAGILAMLVNDDGDLWFSRMCNSDLVHMNLTARTTETISGGSALLKCCLLTNRRNVITQNTKGQIQRWDIVSCTLVNTFDSSSGDFDELVHQYNTKEILPHWCSVSIKTGKLFVKLSEKFLSTEVYGSALELYEFANKVELGSEERYNLGRIVVNSILKDFIAYELTKDKIYRKELVSKKQSAPSTPLQVPSDPDNRPQLKEKRRLSLFTKFTSNSQNASSQQMTPSSLPSTPLLAEQAMANTEEYLMLPPPASAPTVADSQPRDRKDTAVQPLGIEGRSASSGSLLNRKLKMLASTPHPTHELSSTRETPGAGLELNGSSEPSSSDTPEENVESAALKTSKNGVAGSTTTETSESQAKAGLGETTSDFMFKLREEYAKVNQPSSSSFKLLGKRPPESKIVRNSDLPIIEISSGVLLSVNCWKEGSSAETVCFSTYLAAPHPGKDVDSPDEHQTQVFESLEQNLPFWMAEALFNEDQRAKEYPKLSFIIRPWNDPAKNHHEKSEHSTTLLHNPLSLHRSKATEPPPLPHIPDANTTLSAPSVVKIKKVLQYIIDRFESKTPEMKTKMKAADWLEILCKGQVVDPEATLNTVRTLNWKSQADIILEYRRKNIKEH